MKAIYIQGTRNFADRALQFDKRWLYNHREGFKQANRTETIPLRISNNNREKNRTASLTAAAAAFLHSGAALRSQMTFSSQHALRSQARGLEDLGPGLPPTLCCITLDKPPAILSPQAPTQVRRSLEYATLQSHLPAPSQNDAQYYLCQMDVLGRRNYSFPALEVLPNSVWVLPSLYRLSEVG